MDELREKVESAMNDARDLLPDRPTHGDVLRVYSDAAIAAVLPWVKEELANVAEDAPYKKGGLICGCSEGLANYTAAAIRAWEPKA
jgi:hypothetical protein